MSFELTRSSIDNIERNEKISLDLLLELLDVVCKDVLNHNGVRQIEEVQIEDVDKALVKELALLRILLPVYRDNKEDIDHKPAVIRQKHEAAAQEMQEAIEDIFVLESEVTKLVLAQEELAKKKEELQSKKAALDNENDKLQNIEFEISELKDAIKEKEEVIKNFPAAEKRQEYNELFSEYTVMNNCFSSVVNDDFLKETLFKTSKGNGELKVESHPDLAIVEKELDNMKDVQEWFEKVGERIKALLNVFEGVVERIAAKGEEITATHETEEK